MKVARLHLPDGRVFHTDRIDDRHIAQFFRRAYDEAPMRATEKGLLVELIDMTLEEYQAIPATAESVRLFGV